MRASQFNIAIIWNIALSMNSKVLIKVYYVGVPLFIHGAREIIYENPT
jgi:hypothetical protein